MVEKMYMIIIKERKAKNFCNCRKSFCYLVNLHRMGGIRMISIAGQNVLGDFMRKQILLVSDIELTIKNYQTSFCYQNLFNALFKNIPVAWWGKKNNSFYLSVLLFLTCNIFVYIFGYFAIVKYYLYFLL